MLYDLSEEHFLFTVSKDEVNPRQLNLDIKSALSPLPTSHFQTLKYLIGHLNR